ncbi:hypothetical protein [Corallococcus sp. RDP092CA]|uniref:hypothetical protein n=1 Tax=Corallococcus sp. RDP092CA TaxID=3109369 RepID=UPI0035B25ABF
MMLPNFESSNVVYAMPALCRSATGSVDEHGRGAKMEVGHFTAWICAECGLTDWFAVGVQEALARLASVPNSGVSLIEHEQSPR